MISNLEYYKSFYYVANLGSFSAAAEVLHLTQSAVSQSVKKLEQETGTALFLRGSRSIRLTDEGEILFRHIRTAFQEIQTGEQALKQFGQLKLQEFILGATETAFHYGLPDVLLQYRTRYPDIKINVKGTTTQELISLMKADRLDIAVLILADETVQRLEDDGIRIIQLTDVQDAVYSAANTGISPERCYSLHELASFPMISVTSENSVRRLFDAWFAENGMIFSPDYTVKSMNMVLSLVESGIGIGFLPERYAESSLSRGSIKELRTESLPKSRKLVLAYPDKTTISPGISEFIKTAEARYDCSQA